jgi:hypothetical protein
MRLNSKELNKLADLVAEKTEQSDFEYQDEDYQEFLNDLQDKLNRMYVLELKTQ